MKDVSWSTAAQIEQKYIFWTYQQHKSKQRYFILQLREDESSNRLRIEVINIYLNTFLIECILFYWILFSYLITCNNMIQKSAKCPSVEQTPVIEKCFSLHKPEMKTWKENKNIALTFAPFSSLVKPLYWKNAIDKVDFR